MRIVLLTVGRTDVPWVREGLGLYVSRLSHYVPFELKEIPELKGAGSLSRDRIKSMEGELILKALKPSDRVVLLDERGEEMRSVDLAARLSDALARGGQGDLVFVVGGAYGFSDEVYARAGAKLSLSRMTFSHQMVRTVFAEQLYRAFTIIRGEPYHHE